MPKAKKVKIKSDNVIGESDCFSPKSSMSLDYVAVKDNKALQDTVEGLTSWFFGNQPVVKPTVTTKKSAQASKLRSKICSPAILSQDSDIFSVVTAPCLTPPKQASLQMSSSHSDSRDKKDCQLIMKLTKQYFEGVRKSILDTVPKAIMFFLVDEIRSNLHNELVRNLYDESKFDDLLTENESVEQRRRHCFATLTSLDKAVEILSEVNEAVLF
uniref:GED domain-containing protein n=1 Tax=Rhabditophanes sp. KR3021 TaxID=114890 RepID=A0AC35U8S1_9BILA